MSQYQKQKFDELFAMKLSPCFNPFRGIKPTHALKDEVEKGALQFMEQYRLYWQESQRKRLYGQDCGGIAGYIYQMAPDREHLQIGADFAIFTFTWDDEFCDEGPTRDKPLELADAAFRTMRCFEAHDVVIDESNRYAMAGHDILQRIKHLCPAHQTTRWVNTMRQWYFTEIQKAANVARGVRPKLNDYLVTRLHSGATPTFMLNVEIVNGLDLGPDLLSDRRIFVLMEIVALATNIGGDCYGYAKEVVRTADGYNIIDVLIDEYDCSTELAFKLAFDMLANMLKRFVELRDEVLRTKHSPGAELYFQALEGYFVGAQRWCQETMRYRRLIDDTTDSQLTRPPPGFTDQWEGSSISEPSPIPSIAWWWRVGERANTLR